MTIWTLFLLALGLSMDAFAVSVTNSMCFAQFTRRQAVATSACFGLFQGLMPLAGYFLGRVFAQWIGAVDHWVAFALLGLIGGSMLWEAVQDIRRTKKEGAACPAGRQFGLKMMLVQALATSIDALAVGVSFAALSVNIWLAACLICCITVACCLLGHALGRRFGLLLGARAQLCGGAILVAIGVKILIEHLTGG